MFGDLSRGSSGTAVRELQMSLTALGYDVGQEGADGIFGTNTDGAVRAFQRESGIGVDGIVGPETLGALGAALASVPGVAPGDAVPTAVQTRPRAPVQASMLGMPWWLYLAAGGAVWFLFLRGGSAPKKSSSSSSYRRGKAVTKRMKATRRSYGETEES